MAHSSRIEVVNSMAEDQIQESLTRHRKRNADLRQVLLGKGVNLTEQRPADVHFWAWTQRDAAVLARELFKKGFLVKLLSPSPTPDDEAKWGIEAGALVVPDQILGDEFTEGMVRLAAQCDSVYDGWGTET
jgi:regulator of RNase E activity RraB